MQNKPSQEASKRYLSSEEGTRNQNINQPLNILAVTAASASQSTPSMSSR